eukprot:TRINITY_DN10269_c0_g1_i2.p1 TRINITY_DN10269_c0_g1~~TRINITY_DN10269_c0_g1_i2.p1  ORF type:complete len:156 (+),score=64.47 TRINITY_DN10269_c0_g1_i2:203-670(+)
MAFLGLTYTGPQSVFQYHDREPNTFNQSLVNTVPPEQHPPEIQQIGWTKNELNLAELYPEKTPLRQLKKQAQELTRKATTEHTSGEAYRNGINKHSRGTYNPQQKWHAPITSAQSYGWSDKQPGADEGVMSDPKFHKVSSEEARYAEAMTKQGMI